MVASNWHITLPIGLALLVLGVFMKPRDEPIRWSFFWGLATSSSGAGKFIYILGALLAAIGAYGWMKY